MGVLVGNSSTARVGVAGEPVMLQAEAENMSAAKESRLLWVLILTSSCLRPDS
jgi:hypothetical protein